jgi:hypothetical protein
MTPAYRALLPAWLAAMVDEAEAAMALQIEVTVDPAQAKGRPDEPDPLACQMSASSARILVPAEGYFPAGSVLHELLHLRRVLVDGVPRLVVADTLSDDLWSPRLVDSLVAHDNALEHLVIVPREMEVLPERRAYWEAKMVRVWSDLASGMGSPVNQRQAALVNWFFLRRVLPGSPSTATAEAVLANLALMEAAEAGVAQMSPVLSDKIALTSAWFRVAGIDRELADFEYIDSRAGTTRRIPMTSPAG